MRPFVGRPNHDVAHSRKLVATQKPTIAAQQLARNGAPRRAELKVVAVDEYASLMTVADE